MNSMILLLALSMPAVNYGWRPAADGWQEYIVQIEAESLEALRNGHEISSAIHPEAGDVRRFVLRMGEGEVPRINPQPARQAHVAKAAHPAQHAVYMLGADRATQGWQPGSDGRLEYIIQLDELAIEALEGGEEITSDIAPEAGDVERFVVRFGNAELPREPVVAASAMGEQAQPAETPPTRLAAAQDTSRAAGQPRYAPVDPRTSTPQGWNTSNPPARTDQYAPTTPNTRTQSSAPNVPATNPYRVSDNQVGPYTNSATQGNQAPRTSGGAAPSLLQPPTSVQAPSWDLDSDPDDDSTAARIGDQRWASVPPAYENSQGNRAPPVANDQWGNEPYPDPDVYPNTDWRQPRYGADPANQYAPRDPREGAPQFSRPGGSELNVAEAPRAPARSASLPRTSTRPSTEGEYDDEQSPSSLQAPQAPRRAQSPEDPGSLLKELVLFASLGINVVAVLIARQYYLRYRMLIREMRDPDTSVVA